MTPIRQIGAIDAVRYLLMTHAPQQFHIELNGDDTIENYLLHLSSQKKWLAYQNYIRAEIKKIKKELSELNSTQLNERELYEQTQKHLDQLIIQEKNTQKIDAIVQDGKLQEALILNDKHENMSNVTDKIAAINELVKQSVTEIEMLKNFDKINVNIEQKKFSFNCVLALMQIIPLINDIFRGVIYLREAFCQQKKLARNPTLLSGILGIFIFGIASILSIVWLVSSKSNMGLIILSIICALLVSFLLGIYTITLCRDIYVLHQIKKKIIQIKNEIKLLETDVLQIKEIIISNCLNYQPLMQYEAEIQATQTNINEARAQLNNLLQNNPTAHDAIEDLHQDITDLCSDRNTRIMQHPAIYESVLSQFYRRPDLAILSLQKNNMMYTLNQLQEVYEKNSKKIIASLASCVAVFFLLATVCIAQSDKFTMLILSVMLLLGATTVRVYIFYEEKNPNKNVTIDVFNSLHGDERAKTQF